MEVFATGLALGESPRWHDGRLWVCDWVGGRGAVLRRRSGERRVELTMTGLPFSVDWLPDGRTVLTSARGRGDGGGRTAPLTAYGATGEGWNEIVVDPRGNTFVNAPGFDLMGGEEPRAGTRRGGAPGRLVAPGGRRRVVPQRDGGHPRRRHADRRRVLRALPDRLRHRRRRWAVAVVASGPTSATRRPDGICLDAEGASGTPTCRTGAACASPRAARCSRPSRSTAAASPACSAATTAGRCSSSPRAGAAPAGSARASRPAGSSPTARRRRTPGAP